MDFFARIFLIMRATLNCGKARDWEQRGNSYQDAETDPPFVNRHQVDHRLAGYYANLEIPFGSDLEDVRQAWKRQLKKYHPDLHAKNPEKRQMANELTAELTRAYREIERVLSKKEKL
jgi:DnaJ-domain-containing protein 1